MAGRRSRFGFLRRRPDAVAAEVDEELAGHLALRIEELRRQGLSSEAARREALRQFGDVEATRRYCRQQDEQKETRMQRMLLVEDLVQDARICVRSLRRAPILTLTIVLTVGLGIGATTAIFSAVNAALLRPLPYHDPDRLVRLYTDTPPFVFRFSAADYLAFTEQQTQFAQAATYTDRAVTYSDAATAQLLRARVVSWGFFSLLGITPALGRDFSEADGKPGSPITVIASHAFWMERLGGRAEVIGSPVRVDGTDYALVGVLPQRAGPLEQGYDLFIIQQFAPPPRKGPFFYTPIARLKPGVEPAAAEAELRAINKRIFPIWKSSYQDDKSTWGLMDLKRQVVGDVSRTAAVALTAVALLWLIACTNASSLLVARVTSRARELAVRAALGASRGRVVRYLLAESSVLALGSVIVGVALAWVGIELLHNVGPRFFPRMREATLGGSERLLLIGLMVASAGIFGLIPALHGTGRSSDDALRASSRGATGSHAVRRLRRVLVATQFAIATPLLVVAGLLLGSLAELHRVDLGFDHRNVITGSIRLPSALYSDPSRARTFWEEADRQLQALPGIGGVAFADGRPPNGVGNLNNFDLEDAPTPSGASQPATPWLAVTPAYFRTLGLTLFEGRLLEERDALTDNVESVVVDRAWAHRFFPNGSAVGKRFREGGCTTCPWTSVVGVVSDVKYAGLDKPNDGTVYWPMNPSAPARFVVLRTRVESESVLSSVRAVIRGLEPGAPLSSVATVEALVEQSLDRPQSLSTLIAALAAMALLLAVLGIYGVMAYYVQQHEKEIGIRMALGGRAADVLQLIIGQGMRVVVAGIAIGLAAAIGVARLIGSLLFGVSATDPLTFAGVGALLLATALAACAGPARRAVLVQPAHTLRND